MVKWVRHDCMKSFVLWFVSVAVIAAEENRILVTEWLHCLGWKSVYSTPRSGKCVSGTSWWASGCVTGWWSGVVAKQDWEYGGAVIELSAVSTLTSSSTYATLELAAQPMVTSTHRLCWTYGWKDDLGCCWRYRSKWIEAYPMATATAGATIQQLRQLFAQFGIPQLIMLLNLKLNGIHHIWVAPYHPSSNGLAERAIKIVKQGLKKQSEGTLSDQIARILFSVLEYTTHDNGFNTSWTAAGQETTHKVGIVEARPRAPSTIQTSMSACSWIMTNIPDQRLYQVKLLRLQDQCPVEFNCQTSCRVQLSDGTVRRTHDYLRKRSCDG